MKLVIYGNSDFAELMYYYFSTDSKYEVVAFCADKEYITTNDFLGKPLVAFEDIGSTYPPEEHKMFVAIGYRSMRIRKSIYEKTKLKGYLHANYISSSSCMDASNKVGENNAILHNVVLEPYAVLGNNNVINTNTVICHHAVISDHCFIAANSLIGGFSQVKDNCFIGFSSTTLQKLILDEETLIAAGSLMNVNSKKYTMYAGTPAKAISTHEETGIEIKD